VSLPRDRERDLERLLGDGSGEFGALYRRLPRLEPPRRLDRAVLGEAARAVRGRAPRRQRWLVGLGSAAGLVLAAGIAWRVGQDALQQHGTGAPQVIQVQPITEPAPRRAPAAAPDAARPSAAPSAVPPGDAAREAPPPAAPRPVAAPPAKAAPKPRAAPPAESASAPAQAATRRSLPPPPAPPAPPAAPPPAPVPAAAPAASAADTVSKAERETALPQARSERKRTTAPTAPSTSAELRRDLQLAPADWLAHIRQLLQQGRRQQAAESLRLFRRAHPDWTLPEDLAALSD